MFFAPFWIILAIVVLSAGLTLYFKRPEWVDLQVFIMVIALGMSSDMIFCKQLQLYHYVSFEFKGWYSFWANLIIIPSCALIFTKFLPAKKKFVLLYIIVWTIGGTLFELLITGPFGIVLYMKWHVIPYSGIGSIIYFYIIYRYRCLLKRLFNSAYKGKASS